MTKIFKSHQIDDISFINKEFLKGCAHDIRYCSSSKHLSYYSINSSCNSSDCFCDIFKKSNSLHSLGNIYHSLVLLDSSCTDKLKGAPADQVLFSFTAYFQRVLASRFNVYALFVSIQNDQLHCMFIVLMQRSHCYISLSILGIFVRKVI